VGEDLLEYCREISKTGWTILELRMEEKFNSFKDRHLELTVQKEGQFTWGAPISF
jgi:predicted nucleic acid-binding OB-fold protein